MRVVEKQYKIFGGKRYWLLSIMHGAKKNSVWEVKGTADRLATSLIKEGHLAKAVKVTGGYSVFLR